MCTDVVVTNDAVIGRVSGDDIIVISLHYNEPFITYDVRITSAPFELAHKMTQVKLDAMNKALEIVAERRGIDTQFHL